MFDYKLKLELNVTSKLKLITSFLQFVKVSFTNLSKVWLQICLQLQFHLDVKHRCLQSKFATCYTYKFDCMSKYVTSCNKVWFVVKFVRVKWKGYKFSVLKVVTEFSFLRIIIQIVVKLD